MSTITATRPNAIDASLTVAEELLRNLPDDKEPTKALVRRYAQARRKDHAAATLDAGPTIAQIDHGIVAYARTIDSARQAMDRLYHAAGAVLTEHSQPRPLTLRLGRIIRTLESHARDLRKMHLQSINL